MRILRLFILVSLVLIPLTGMGNSPDNTGRSTRTLDEIVGSGTIYIAFTSDDLKNINFELARRFADYLKVELKVVEIDWDEAFMQNGVRPPGLESDPDLVFTPDALQKADIICSTFTILEWRKRLFGFARTLESAELLVIEKNGPPPKDFESIGGRTIAFMGGTSFEENLLEINKGLNTPLVLHSTGSSEEGKELLREGEVYGLVLDADEALNFIASSEQDRFQLALPVSEITHTAWATTRDNRELIEKVESYFATIESDGSLNSVFQEQFSTTYEEYQGSLRRNRKMETLQRDLADIQASGKLVVAVRERNFVYSKSGQKQFMHALAEEFADYLGVDLEIRITPGVSRYWEDSQGKIIRDSAYTPEWFNYFDLACETLAPLSWRTNKTDMVPVYRSAYTVIAGRDADIQSMEDLRGLRGITIKSSIYEDMLLEQGLDSLYYASVNECIPYVLEGKADYTVLYNAFSELSRHPELENKIELGKVDVSWALRKDQPELKKKVEEFIQVSTQNGLIGVLQKALMGNTLQSTEAFILSYYESLQSGQLPNVSYGAADGLPQEEVFATFQDRRGYIWFGTNSGLVRYNGRDMVAFDQGLPSNSIRDISQDSSGNLYFASTNGIARMDESGEIRTIFSGASFHSVFVDSRNRVWFLSDQGLFYLSADGEKLESVNPTLPARINHMTENPLGGQLILTAPEGAFLYTSENDTYRQIWHDASYAAYVDAGEQLWLSTRKGLLIAPKDQASGYYRNSSFRNLNRELDFPLTIITDIRRSRFGALWMIGESRLIKIISSNQRPMIYEQDAGVKNNKILSLEIDHEENIWLGYSGGLQRLPNSRGLRIFYPETIDGAIYSCFQDPKGRTWFASDNGIFYFQDDRLINFTSRLGSTETLFFGTLLPDGNIILVNNREIIKVSSLDLRVLSRISLSHLPHSVEKVFAASTGDVFLLTGIHGVIYHLPSGTRQVRKIPTSYSSDRFQLIEFKGRILGGDNQGFVQFSGEEFRALDSTDWNIWSLHASGDSILVGGEGRLGVKRENRSGIVELCSGLDMTITSILPARNRNYLWLGTNRGLAYFNVRSQEVEFTRNTKDGLSGNEITQQGLMLDDKGLLWVGSYHGISNFNLKAFTRVNFAPVCYIETFLVNGEAVEPVSGKSFSHRENNLVLELSALSFSDESSIEYFCYLRSRGQQEERKYTGPEYRFNFDNLSAGKYVLVYQAKGKDGIWGYSESFSFTIRKAWYDRWVIRILITLVFIALLFALYRYRVASIKAQNERLEKLVRERTSELEAAKAEIQAQFDFAEQQHQQILRQQKEIMSSIAYAQNIQNSLLPSREKLGAALPSHFVFFKPRDIVSGDFYWFSEQKEHTYMAAADCTGHGIPGAFMSMLGMALMNEIVNQDHSIEPAAMLNRLREQIMETLGQIGEPGAAKDGMDMVLIRLDKKSRRLQFAGAQNPLYHIRDNELSEYKGDKMPVSIHEVMDPFSPQEIEIREGDAVFIFSDGYADQFGGDSGKKFKYKPFKELLTGLNRDLEDFSAIENKLDRHFSQWKGELDQIDDVVVVGIKF